MLTRRDCFNSRLKNQGESRADRVTSWRDRGNNDIQETHPDNNDRMIEIESIWSDIPNAPLQTFSTSYGDHQVKNCGSNPFRTNKLTIPSLLPCDVSEPQPFQTFSNENKLWFENLNYQGGNTGYSLFGNSTVHAQPLKNINSGQINEQPLDRRFSCMEQRQKIEPFCCTIQEQSLQTTQPMPKPTLSWSQVVAEVKVPAITAKDLSTERMKLDDTTFTGSTSLDIETDKSPEGFVFTSVCDGRASKKYISDSSMFSQGDDRMFSHSPSLPPYLVIKVQNVPWCSSSDDLNKFINKSPYLSVPSVKDLPHNVHVIMDRYTGKTCGVAFIQVKVKNNVIVNQDTVNQLSRLPLQGRRLKFFISTYDELRRKLFSTYAGSFKNGMAIPFMDIQDMARVEDEAFASNGTAAFFIGQRDLQSVLQISRNYKVFYNRKCPERSFEYIMSIAMNIPWMQIRAVSTCQRDIIYECYKLATDYLRIHTSKPLHSFNSSLFPRFIRTALVCDGFTVRQKLNILKTAQQTCPTDLVKYITVEEEKSNPERTTPMDIDKQA